MRQLRRDDGMSAVIGFVIAILLFSISFYYVVEQSVQRESDTTVAEHANLSGSAHALANVVLGPGLGWYSGAACVGTPAAHNAATWDPEGVAAGRFGLGDPNCAFGSSDARAVNNLSFEKISNLFSADMQADPTNDRVDYQEARQSLQLGSGATQFHLRSWPILPSIRQVLGSNVQDPNIRPLYLGDYVDGPGAPPRPSITSTGTATDGTDFVTLNVQIDNTGSPTVISNFQISYSISLDGGTMTFTQNSFDIPAGGSDTVTVKIRKTMDWTWANPAQQKVTYGVSDGVGQLVTGEIGLSSINMANPSNNANNVIAVINMDRLHFQEEFTGNNKWPKASYRGYNGHGQTVASFDGDDVDLKVVEITPNVYSRTITVPNKNGEILQDISPVPDEPDVGRYRVELWVPDIAGTLHNDDVFEVWPTGGADECRIGVGDFIPGPSVATETAFVDQLIRFFDRNVYASNYHDASMQYAAGGDVYADIKCSMNNDLPAVLLDAAGNPTLAEYNTLIVGSNVDHDAMTSAAAKDTIHDWVFAGGTLIVFGSDQQSVTWLQPIFHSALTTANGPIMTPDADHAVLNVPNQLDVLNYNLASEWDYNAHAGTKFTHVVTAGETGDLLAIGNPGAFGDGQVILSGWRPYDLTPGQSTSCPTPLTADSNCQGAFLFHNLITMTYRQLYLDYGPPIPLQSASGVQTRLASTYHPQLQTLVTLQLQVFVFEG